jgi:hypothetical protein
MDATDRHRIYLYYLIFLYGDESAEDANPLPVQSLTDYTKLANVVELTGDKLPRSGTSVPLRQFTNGIRRPVSGWLPLLQCGSLQIRAGVKSRR